jgi:hypothetical protein
MMYAVGGPMHPIISTHKWIVDHPVVMLFASLIASGLISLYSQQIRGFLHTWPIRTLRSANLNVNRKQLQLLESLHNNTYNLVIYLALAATSFVGTAFNWLICLNFANLIFSLHFTLQLMLIPAIVGPIFGKSMQVNIVLRELCHYDKRTAELRASIEYHENKVRA